MSDESELETERLQNQVAAALQDLVLDTRDVQDFLDGLVTVASEAFSTSHGEVFCGVTLLRPDSMTTVASSSDLAQRMDEVQYGFDDGPCLRAAREGYTVHIPNFLTEPRFPEYRAAIASYGVRSALGIPIRLEDGASAGLNFYSTEIDAFAPESISVAERIARDASKSLRLAVRTATIVQHSTALRTSMEDQQTIELATGVMMGRNRCTHEQASAMLQSAATTRGTTLHDVAAGILQSLGTSETDTHFDT
jgi:GAF domain-containing protein